jgi:alkylation response protein AidB-like acyl-CoA dehydrogenase
MTTLPTLSLGGDGQAAPWADALAAAREVAEVAAAHAEADDRPRGFPEAGLAALRQTGLLTAPLSAEHGGLGLGTAPGSDHALCLALAEVGRGSLPLGRIWEGHVNALVLIEAYGTEAQKARWAVDARDGHLFGVWNTEVPSDGVHYTRDGDRVRVEGAKTFATGGAFVTRPLVPGALGDGWQMVVLPTDALDVGDEPGWWRAEGMRASRSGRVDFSGAEVPADCLLGAPGDYLREPLFTGGSVRFAAVQLGGAQALADAAVSHLNDLGRAGHPVQQVRLGEVATLLETGRLWLLGASRLGGAEADAVCAYARMARSAIERVCLDVLERSDRAVGARGLGRPGVLERVGRDLRLYLRQPDPDGALAEAGAFFAAERRPPLGSDL